MNNAAAAPQRSRSSSESKPLKRGWLFGFILAAAAAAAIGLSDRLDWQAWLGFWPALVDWGRLHLVWVSGDSPLSWVLCPALLMLAWSGSLLLAYDKPPNWVRLPVTLVFLFFQLGYLAFRLVATLSLDTTADAVVSILFFLSEAFIHFRIAVGNLLMLRLTDRSARADESERLVESGVYLPAVDVLVPTYSEPVEMLQRTIIGCQTMDYPRKTIYLLDDQRRPAMRQLAQALGCRYLDRPDNRHAKAGNLNHALEFSDGELILCFDADFVPTRDFIRRTVGFFQDPQVAMVQTPQNFFNEDAVTRNLGVERALEDEQRLFFRAIQPGRDSANAIVCHGSCFMVRRAALEAIGGIPTETITEDWATSIKLQAAGYKLYYLNEALSAGVSADRCGEFVQQRSRWAQGTLQALFASTNPLTIPGLNWKQRLIHFAAILYYLGGLSSFFNLLAPLFFLFFGLHILRMTVPEMFFYRLPLTVGYYALFSWLTCRTRSALWTELYDALLAPVMCRTAVRSLCKPFGAGFRVTDKTAGRRRLSVNRHVSRPFIILFALHVLGLMFAFATEKQYEDPDAFAIATWFAASNLVTLWLCLLVTADVAQEHPFTRFQHRLPCLLLWDDSGLTGETVSLSEGEIVFRASQHVPPAKLPKILFVHLPAICQEDLQARVKKIENGGATLEFVDLTLPQRRALIAFLYCRPGQWNRPPRSELRAMWEYVRAGVRMYPLTESA